MSWVSHMETVNGVLRTWDYDSVGRTELKPSVPTPAPHRQCRVARNCNPGSWEVVEARTLKVQGHLQLQINVEVSLSYMRPDRKENTQNLTPVASCFPSLEFSQGCGGDFQGP